MLASMLLPHIIGQGPLYGRDVSTSFRDPSNSITGRKRIIVEFSSPNIGLPISTTELHCTILGEYVASIYESMGWNVIRWNYLGDWGRHIWLLILGWKRYGSEQLLEADPLGHFFDISTRIHCDFQPELEALRNLQKMGQDTSNIESQGLFAEMGEIFKRLEDGDSDVMRLLDRFRNLSIAGYTSGYSLLNIAFNEYSGESRISQQTIAEVESILKKKGICKESNGSLVIDAKEFGFGGHRAVLRTGAGTTTYFLRDVAATLERSRKYRFDKMVYVVEASHLEHFRRVCATLHLMGFEDLERRLHLVLFSKGHPRSFNSLSLRDVLNQFQTASENVVEADMCASLDFAGLSPEGATIIGTTALRVQILATKRQRRATIDASNIGDFRRDTGFRLQQWYLRLCSILHRAGIDSQERARELLDLPVSEDRPSRYFDCLRLLIQFPEVVMSSYIDLEPSIVLKYLFRLVDELSIMLDDEDEIGPAVEHRYFSLASLESCRQVLENGMKMLGIMPLGVEYLEP